MDCRNLIALPGLIDAHVHFREPGSSHKEDWYTGSAAAAAGGVTTVLDMPNTLPPTLTFAELERKRGLARKSLVDYGFHLGASLAHPNACADHPLLEQVAGVKFYFNETTGNLRIALYDNGRDRVTSMMRALVKSRVPAVLHAEGNAARDALELVRRAGCSAVVAHTPGRAELSHIAEARSRGASVRCEVAPHHLFLSKENLRQLGTFAVMKPPLGSRLDQTALWDAVRSRTADLIASDHAPHTSAEKLLDKAPFGVPGLETTLPLLLDAQHRGLLSLQDIQRLCSESPASVFGLKEKGRIAEGFDADLVLVDPGLEQKVQNGKLHTKCGWSPFHGRLLKGWPVMTFVRGQLVFRQGEVLQSSGREVRYAR